MKKKVYTVAIDGVMSENKNDECDEQKEVIYYRVDDCKEEMYRGEIKGFNFDGEKITVINNDDSKTVYTTVEKEINIFYIAQEFNYTYQSVGLAKFFDTYKEAREWSLDQANAITNTREEAFVKDYDETIEVLEKENGKNKIIYKYEITEYDARELPFFEIKEK